MVQPAQRQVVDAAPRGIMFVLPQRCAGHGINGGFVDLYVIAGFRFGGNQKAIDVYKRQGLHSRMTAPSR